MLTAATEATATAPTDFVTLAVAHFKDGPAGLSVIFDGIPRQKPRARLVTRALCDLHAREAGLATCYEKRHKGRTVYRSLSVGPVLTASGSGAPLR